MWERQCKAVIRFDYPAADRMGNCAVGECLFLREVRGTIVVPEWKNIDPSAVFPVDF